MCRPATLRSLPTVPTAVRSVPGMETASYPDPHMVLTTRPTSASVPSCSIPPSICLAFR
jgi:hypothetical protein